MDDDDWFAPNLAEVLDREWDSELGDLLDPQLDRGRRRTSATGVHLIRRGLLPFTPPHLTCETNNYGAGQRPGGQAARREHLVATHWFDGPGRESVKRIRQRISLHNRNMASQTSLRPTAHRGELTPRRLRRRLLHHQRALPPAPLAPRPPWARPYVAMMADLMDELRPR